ncbi:MAG: hypothetical protein DRR42_09045 [Gammaproteobacteria bacterium]|nr:MAG: hypothetical protein DRR42_09045 [Gammaproteobacteria bacterium]
MSYEWEWFPNRSLGPVTIGSNIEIYIANLALVKDESTDATGWDTYILPDFEIYIDVEDGKVISITAYREFLYKGRNLVGTNLIELDGLIDAKADEVGQPVEYEDGDIKTPYEYFGLGLQVWVSKNRVTSISCMSYE